MWAMTAISHDKHFTGNEKIKDKIIFDIRISERVRVKILTSGRVG